MDHFQIKFRPTSQLFLSVIVTLLLLLAGARTVFAVTIELNSGGGTTATNGLHFYIDNTSKIQVKRLNNTGQVYSPTVTPPNNALDNGVFLRANGTVYGPSHTVTTFAPTAYSTTSITATSPANPSSSGVQQSVTNTLGVTAGPQISIVWKYTTPLDFLTAEVTLTIPAAYAVSVANPVRYYHVFDTYLGGSDKGCGVNVAGPPRIVGTYSSIAGACPTSTALPAAGTVVESFRERTGTFSNYCANVWNSFFTNNAVNCSVLQAAVMSNSISTTEIDTGIGIEYNFTAPGTYTFSYDFVIGTTIVPAYDHLEIQHDGSATLCPENVTVLACTSTTVPCPAGSVVNTGTLTGNLTVTPAAPAVSVTPTTFSIGPTVYTPTVVLQGTGAGTYTLGISGISGTVPLNGIKCSNGTIATSCSMVIANTPCVANFECIETSKAYNNLTLPPPPPPALAPRNPLYTKLAGADFKFDVVALQALGVPATGYTAAANVVVELFDDSAASRPACNAYSSPVASQPITFVAGDLGRKTLPIVFNLPKAYSKLICRVRDSNLTPNIYGCSSDDFAVRPQTISSVSSTNATPIDSTSATAGPLVKAGAAFNLTADTATVGYNGLPKIDTSLIEWLNPPAGGRPPPSSPPGTGAGILTGLFTTPANATTGNGALGSTFNYDEVGYFHFKPQGVFDDSFTSSSGDSTVGACVAGVLNPCDCTPDASNTLDVSGKYGCKFGNTVTTAYFGRFIPDHFVLASTAPVKGCAAGGFTYMDQDQTFALNASLEARNAANLRTQNYSDVSFGKGVVTPQMLDTLISAPFTTTVVAANRLNVVASAWNGGAYSFTANKLNARSVPIIDGPYNNLAFGLSITDADLVPTWDRNMDVTNPACTVDLLNTSSAAAAACKAVKIETSKMRYGRLRMQNAFGSESLDLPVSVIAQYWNGNGWIQNVDDSCTTIVAPTFGSGLTFYPEVGATVKGNHLSAGETTATVSATTMLVAGDAKFKLSKPGLGNNGYVDITFTAPAWLQFPWKSTAITNPTARATFGIYKNANEFIYMREIH